MIHIEKIDREHGQDILLPNEPFALTGKVIPHLCGGKVEL